MNYTKTTSRYEDDSEVIDIIDSAKTQWFKTHPDCDAPTDESTDEAINKALGLPPSGAIRELRLDLADYSPNEISAEVKRGLDSWFSNLGKENEFAD